MINRIVAILQGWLRLTRAVESLLIDVIAATAPWLAPLIPAFMAWDSMTRVLLFPPWVALAGAGVVELLGLSAVYTSFQLWEYNDSRRVIDQAAPTKTAIAAASFYLIVVLTVNVLLDQAPAIQRLAKALLSTLSIIAAVILAIRSQHSRRLTAIEQDRQRRREERREARERKEVENSGKLPAISAVVDWRSLPLEDRQLIKTMSTAQIVNAYHVSERTARNWRTNARSNGHIQTLERIEQ